MYQNLTYLLYSHSSYIDILYIHLNQIKKYLPSSINIKIAFNDIQKFNEKFEKAHNYDVVNYDEKEPYFKRIYKILTNIQTKYVLLQHENNILIDYPKENIFENTITFMDNFDVDQVRMIRAGINNKNNSNSIFDKINEGYFFSVISGIWKTTTLEQISLKFQEHDYRCAECFEVQNFVKNFYNYYISSERDISLTNQSHVISYYFPFIHLTREGKWITNKNDKQQYYVQKLLEEYNIDPNIRDVFSY